MKIPDVAADTARWLRRSLCRRYAFVVFSSTSKVQVNAASDASRTFSWSLGTLLNGDREALGVWPSGAGGAVAPIVFGELYHRGAEYITYGLGDLAGARDAFTTAYPRVVLLPSVEQSLAAALASVKPMHRQAMKDLLLAMLADPIEEPRTVSPSGISSADCRERYPMLLKQWEEAVAGFQPLFALPEPYRHLVRSVDRTAMDVQQRLTRAIQRHGPFSDSVEAFDFVAAALQRANRWLHREARAGRLARGALGPQATRTARRWAGAVGTPALA